MAMVSPALRAGTLRLTLAAMGVVLGLSAAGVLPLLLPWAGEVTLVLSAMAFSFAPFAGVWLARRLRRLQDVELKKALPVAVAVALASGFAVVALFNVYRGQVRVMNLGDEPFALWIDGKRVARVEPSSGESALAGVELTLPAGERELRVVSESSGRELFRARELVEGGSPHLFAPLSAGYCFSIERRAYGDAREQPLDSQPLEGENPFWQLPDGISWFTPNPEPGPFETSGGTLSCLRQKRCSN
jgi:hypothetical protein